MSLLTLLGRHTSSGASVAVTITLDSSSVDLTALGGADYVIYNGDTSLATFHRKSGGGSLISVADYDPSGTYTIDTEAKARIYSATDATPTSSVSTGDNARNVSFGSTGAVGFTVNLPASTGERTAKIYVIGFNNNGGDGNTFEAVCTLGDASASDSTTYEITAGDGSQFLVIDVTYTASSTTTLSVRCNLQASSSSNVRAVHFGAAWVSTAAGSGGGTTNVNLNISSTVTPSIGRSVSLTIADIVTSVVSYARQVAKQFGVTSAATVTRAILLARTITDTVAVTTTVTKRINKLMSIVVSSVSEALQGGNRFVTLAVTAVTAVSIQKIRDKLLAAAVNVVATNTFGRPIILEAVVNVYTTSTKLAVVTMAAVVSVLRNLQFSRVISRLEDLSVYLITLIRDTITYVTGENNVIIVPKEHNVAEGWTGEVVEDFSTIFAFDTDFESTD